MTFEMVWLFFWFFLVFFRFVDDFEGGKREVGVFREDGAFVGGLGKVAEALWVFDFRGGDYELGAP